MCVCVCVCAYVCVCVHIPGPSNDISLFAQIVVSGGETAHGLTPDIFLLDPSNWVWYRLLSLTRPPELPKAFGVMSHGAVTLPASAGGDGEEEGEQGRRRLASRGSARLLVFGGHFSCRGVPSCRRCLRRGKQGALNAASSTGSSLGKASACRGERDNVVYEITLSATGFPPAAPAALETDCVPDARLETCAHHAAHAHEHTHSHTHTHTHSHANTHTPTHATGGGDAEGEGGGGNEETMLFGCGMVFGEMCISPWRINAPRPHPLAVVKAVAAGAKHALLIDGAGSVWSWGENSQGQLGLEGTKRLFRPARIEVLYHMQVVSPLVSSRLTV